MHPCPNCGAELTVSGDDASCPECKSRYVWVIGSGWNTPDAARDASVRDTRGSELAFVVRGYLVGPRSLKDHEPTWTEMVEMIASILANPLYNFQDLTVVSAGYGEAVISDRTGQPLARVTLESPGRVRTVPLDQ